MATRLHKTLIDYVVIAISPALIALLIGSLVLFLVQVFYQGSFEGRLVYIFTLFVIGSVGCSRISIEEGREYSMAFTIPLALATLFAMGRFVEFEGPLKSFSFFINCGLIALIMWSADKLTWDCTYIDDEQEDPGEGLLEAVGLDQSNKAAMQEEAAAPAKQRINPAAEDELRATTSRPAASTTWWDRFIERRRRPHSAGVWVVYFSLAALPLFGLGQLCLPSGDLPARQHAFDLLCVYTASGFGLLLATSFVGMRRYLRQRRLEMPLLMVNFWLGIGAVLIVGVMFIAMLIPRPNAEYAISEIPFRIGSPDQHSSRFGMGNDGIDEDKPWARGEQRDEQEGKSVQSDQPGKTKSDGPKNTSSDGQSPGKSGENSKQPSDSRSDSSKQNKPGQQNEPGKQTDQAKQDDSQKSKPQNEGQKDQKDRAGQKPSESDQSKADGEKSSEKTSKPSNDAGDQAKDASKKAPPQTERQSNDKTSSGSTSNKDDQKKQAGPKEQSKGNNRGGSSQQTPKLPHAPTAFRLPSFTALFKWLFYIALACVIGYALWTHREQVLAALREFGQWLSDFWARLFGGKTAAEAQKEAEAAGPKQPPPRRFVEYANPFQAGIADHYPPEELVRFTFEALEAWARDHGLPRLPEQTPHEFARDLGANVASVGDDARRLADLYCQVAYADRTLPPENAAQLSRLWQVMEADAP